MELTKLASHLQTVADTIRAAFGTMQLGEYAIEMTAPEESTKGGLLALQHLCLRPKTGTGLSIVIGTVNVPEKSVEIKSYGFVQRMCERRFRRSPSFDDASYEAFIDRARMMFANFGCEVAIVDEPLPPITARPPPKSRHVLRYALVVMTIAVLIVLALAVTRRFMLHR